jgi:UDP-N-acetylglucosamine 3-dehydrogenase
LRIAVVGVGNMGFNHARVLRQLADEGLVEFIGVSDISYERALNVAKIFKTNAFKQYEDLFGKIDAVIVSTPTETHRDIAMSFIEYGINVLVEKPIASNVKEALELIDKSNKKGVLLMVGHVGELVTFTAKRVGPFSSRVARTSVIIDLAIHDIDVINSIVGLEVNRIYARSRRIHHDSNDDDYGLIVLTYNSGIDATIETNRLTPYKLRTLEVVGTRGVAVVSYLDQKITIYDGEWIREAVIQRDEPLKLELINFIKSIDGIEKPIVTKEQAAYALLIAEIAVESSKKNKPIQVYEYIKEKNYDMQFT